MAPRPKQPRVWGGSQLLGTWNRCIRAGYMYTYHVLKNLHKKIPNVFVPPCENLPKKKKNTGYNPKSQAWCIGFKKYIYVYTLGQRDVKTGF